MAEDSIKYTLHVGAKIREERRKQVCKELKLKDVGLEKPSSSQDRFLFGREMLERVEEAEETRLCTELLKNLSIS